LLLTRQPLTALRMYVRAHPTSTIDIIVL